MGERTYTGAELVIAEMLADLIADARTIEYSEFSESYYMAHHDEKIEFLFELINKIVGEVNEDFYNTHLPSEAEVNAMNESLRGKRLMEGEND